MNILIIRTDGTEETHASTPATAFKAIEKLINAGPLGLDHVNLRDGRVMLCDGSGYETRAEERPYGMAFIPIKANKPVNEKATVLYHAICKPGTTHQIVGDVAIVVDKDFA